VEEKGGRPGKKKGGLVVGELYLVKRSEGRLLLKPSDPEVVDQLRPKVEHLKRVLQEGEVAPLPEALERVALGEALERVRPPKVQVWGPDKTLVYNALVVPWSEGFDPYEWAGELLGRLRERFPSLEVFGVWAGNPPRREPLMERSVSYPPQAPGRETPGVIRGLFNVLRMF